MRSASGMVGRIAAVVDGDAPPPERGRHRRQGDGGRRAPDRDELRVRQHGFDVHLHRPLTLARDRHGHDAVALVPRELLRRSEEQQPRRAFLERAPSLPDDGGLGAGTAQPPANPPVARDQRRRARLPGRRRTTPHHRGEHERLASRGESRRPQRGSRASRSRSVHRPSLQASAPAAWIASQTFADVSGMSMFFTPRGWSASITALTYAAGEPTVADSPTPFAPIG